MSKNTRRKSLASRPTRPDPLPEKPTIDRLAAWIAGRSRAVRGLLCAGVALAFSVGLALLLYSSLFNVAPDRLNFGPINSSNLALVLAIGVSVIGLVFYWVGWRVMIGFDMEETPLVPGRPAALWLMLGAAVAILVVVGGLLSAVLAGQS